MRGEEPIDGNPTTMHSTQAERGATIGCLWAVTKTAKKYNLKRGACTLYVDNRGSYSQGRIPATGEGPFRHLTEDYDYKAIRTMLEDELERVHSITVKYRWVQGHQDIKPILDKEGNKPPLTKAAKINIECDKRAGEYRREPEETRIPGNNPIMPTIARVYFVSKGQINISMLENQISEHYRGENLRIKLQDKFE